MKLTHYSEIASPPWRALIPPLQVFTVETSSMLKGLSPLLIIRSSRLFLSLLLPFIPDEPVTPRVGNKGKRSADPPPHKFNDGD